MTYTPGPWFRSDNGVFAYDGADEKVLVTATSTERSISIAFSNAQLICAAPDLLEALKDLLRYEAIWDDGDTILEAVRTIARAAIAKAEGEVQ